jgi:hypothetical protein
MAAADEGSGMTPTLAARSRPAARFRMAQCLGALGRRTEASRRTYARAAQVYEATGDAVAGSRCQTAVTPAP